jgi:hypothetical protein
LLLLWWWWWKRRRRTGSFDYISRMFLKKAEVNVVPRYRTLSEVDDSRDSKDSRRSKIFRLLMILEYAADDLETTLRLIPRRGGPCDVDNYFETAQRRPPLSWNIRPTGRPKSCEALICCGRGGGFEPIQFNSI